MELEIDYFSFHVRHDHTKFSYENCGCRYTDPDTLILHYMHCMSDSIFGAVKKISQMKIPERNKITCLKNCHGLSYLGCVYEMNLRWDKFSFGTIRTILSMFENQYIPRCKFSMYKDLRLIMYQWSKSVHRLEIFRIIIDNKPIFSYAFINICKFSENEIYDTISKLKNVDYLMKILQLDTSNLTGKQRELILNAKKIAKCM